MSRAVRMQMPFLELLQATSIKQRKALLQTLTKDNIPCSMRNYNKCVQRQCSSE